MPEGVRQRSRGARGRYERILVLYGDCGTGGLLDQVLAEEGVERIEGPHCYSFFAGSEVFDALAEAEVGTFYLTDYLVRHFERLIIQGLGIDRHPELLPLRSEEHTSELQSLMRISYAVFCLKKKNSHLYTHRR